VTIKLTKYRIDVDIPTFSKYRVDYEYLQSWPISTAQTSCVNQAKKVDTISIDFSIDVRKPHDLSHIIHALVSRSELSRKKESRVC